MFEALLSDEQSKKSTARLAFWVVLLADLAAIAIDIILTPVSAGSLALLTTLTVFTTSWAAGPRIAQYLAPQIGGALGAVSSALRAGEETRRALLERHGTLPPGHPDEDTQIALETEDRE